MKILIFTSLLVCLLLPACTRNPEPAKLPTAPSGVTATPGPGYMTVSWTDKSDNETGFVIYREVVNGATSLNTQAAEAVGEVAANVEIFVDFSASTATNYKYSVSAKNTDGESSQGNQGTQTSRIEAAAKLVPGTFHISDSYTATAFLFYIMLPPNTNVEEVETYTITGPGDWNNNAAYTGEIGKFFVERGWFTAQLGMDAVSGDYTFSMTIAGETYTDTATLDAEDRLPRPTGLTPTTTTSNEVSATWDALQGVVSYQLFIREDPNRFNSTILGRDFVTSTSGTISDLELPTGNYRLELTTYPIDWIGPDEEIPLDPGAYNLSYAVSDDFVIQGDFENACSNPDELVNIPDAGLASAIKSQLGITTDVTCGDMLKLDDELVAEGLDITDLTGLEFATKLKYLYLKDNNVSDLTPLANLPSLIDLYVEKNPIENDDLLILKTLPAFEALGISRTNVTDLTEVAKLSQLRLLAADNMSDMDVNEFTKLAGLTNLEFLYLDNNDLTDISVLTELKKLGRLILTRNTIADLGPLAALTDLERLELDENGISDISTLAGLTNLSELTLSNNQITDIMALVINPGLAAGDELDLSNNQLDLTEGSGDLANIQTLEARGVNVTVGEQTPVSSEAA